MKRLAPFALIFGAAMLLTGCTTGPDYARPSIATPEGWRTPAATNTSIATWAWAELYRDPVLTNLIATALANNQDVRIAAARVDRGLRRRELEREATVFKFNAESSQDPVYWIDPSRHFRFVWVNDACCRHFLRRREELVGLSIEDIDLNGSTLIHGEH